MAKSKKTEVIEAKPKRNRRTTDVICDEKIKVLEDKINKAKSDIGEWTTKIEYLKKKKEDYLSNPKGSGHKGRQKSESTLVKQLAKYPDELYSIIAKAGDDAEKRYQLLKEAVESHESK